jgi:AcrR family transcriptional regulator
MARPSAREKLLDCAEELFADRGLDAVSLRSINAEAGLSAAALHYHFGSKQALLEALLERRMTAPMERRRELLDELDARPGPPTAREILEVLIRPLAELLASEGDGGRRYVRLLSRLQADGGVDHRFVAERFGGGVARLEPLLQRALPEQAPGLVRLRLGLAIELLTRSLASWEQLAQQMRSGEFALDEFVEVLLDFLTGALEAPSHPALTHPGIFPDQQAATRESDRTRGERT